METVKELIAAVALLSFLAWHAFQEYLEHKNEVRDATIRERIKREREQREYELEKLFEDKVNLAIAMINDRGYSEALRMFGGRVVEVARRRNDKKVRRGC